MRPSGRCFLCNNDQVTDAANNEQFVISFSWTDNLLEVHEGFIGLYQVNDIKAEALVNAFQFRWKMLAANAMTILPSLHLSAQS